MSALDAPPRLVGSAGAQAIERLAVEFREVVILREVQDAVEVEMVTELAVRLLLLSEAPGLV